MTELVPAAQYLRRSTDRQEYSLPFQRAVISSYARDHNFNIVTTYTDARSGLALRHLAGFSQLLQDAVSGRQPYKAILVYDVSRWGRYQDSDESAHYEFICRRAGVAVHYCAETFSNDGTMPSAIMKTIKRIMAAEFSRELSEKITLAMTRMVKDGLWAGAMPGYGLRRMLVSNDRTPKQQMKFGERKNLRDDRTVLVPGPAEEIEVIKEIFRLYSREKRSFPHIARKLNDLGIPYFRDSRWTYQAIRQIILNEKYTGWLIWGRYTQKLRSRCVPVAREKWVVVRDVFQPIVNYRTFEAAQAVWARKAGDPNLMARFSYDNSGVVRPHTWCTSHCERLARSCSHGHEHLLLSVGNSVLNSSIRLALVRAQSRMIVWRLQECSTGSVEVFLEPLDQRFRSIELCDDVRPR
jgi:DNA invertase Pin-like site-specific DNA recombinase